MMSLRSTLHSYIKEKGYASYEECVRICMEEGYKPSNMERRLRHSESPAIEAVMGTSKRGMSYIKGYRWIEPHPLPKDFSIAGVDFGKDVKNLDALINGIKVPMFALQKEKQTQTPLL